MDGATTFPTAGARVAARLAALSPWQRHLLAVIAGALSTLAMAPFHAFPILMLTLPVLVLLIDDATAFRHAATGAGLRRRAFLAGWMFTFGYHLVGLFWIGEAFLVEAEKFAALMPFAVTAMPAGLALFGGLATATAASFWRPGFGRIVALALTLSAAEWLRGHVLTGFPWNILGYALTYPGPALQTAGLVGIYGLTLLTPLLMCLPAFIVLEAGPDVPRKRVWGAAVVAAVGPQIVLMGIGMAVAWATPQLPVTKSVRVRIVQPSIIQRDKWRPEHQSRIFQAHLDLSQRTAKGEKDDARSVDLIVWPEAAMPFLPLRSPAALAAIGRMLPQGSVLATGALRMEGGPAPGTRRVFNSLLLLGAGGRLLAAYDKIHLVPFGEYLPFQTTLESIGLEQLVQMRGGFASGPAPRPLIALAGLPAFAPLICYEAIFPASLVQGRERPAVLLNVTNDGWFGNTTGPRQHLHQARVRAAEEGLPLIRAANNGISAIIDANGRIVASLGMDAVGTVDGTVPPPRRPTPYAMLGDSLFFASWLVLFMFFATHARRARQRETPARIG
ncbi:MAG: apolipoprotein N-acyltransferase [Hyphomicrobiaceae bacterium]